MASTPGLEKGMDDILLCSICMERITDPRSLPCLHSFCFKCISNWCSNQKPGTKVACPLCRNEFSIPNDGINNLEKNFFIENLLTLNQLKGADAKKKLCEVCEEEDKKSAKMFCLDCQQCLCKSCSAIHGKLKISSSHNLVSLDEISSSGGVYSKYQSVLCRNHTDKKIEVFCLECKTTLCLMCYINDHSSHKCSDLVKVVDDFRVSLSQDIQRMTAALATYDTNLAAIRQNGVRFEAKVKQVETEICTRYEQLRDKMETERRKLVADLNSTAADHEKEIALAAKKVLQNKSILQRSLDYCRELLEKGSAVDIAQEANSLHIRADQLVKVTSVAKALKDVTDVSFSASELTYSHSDSILGVVLKKGAEPTLLAVSSLATTDVVAIAFLDGELFVILANVGSQVSVYDSVSLELKRNIPGYFSGTPAGLAACSTNKCLYLSDSQKCFIFRLNTSTKSISKAQWRVDRRPGQLSVTSDDHNVLVSCADIHEYGSQGGGISVYSSTGTLIRKLFHNYTIFCALEINKTTLVISCDKGIFTASKDGGVEQKSVALKRGAYCLAADSFGNVVFLDKLSNQVQVLNSSLTPVRDYKLPLPKDKTWTMPQALCYDKDTRRLYVAYTSDASTKQQISHQFRHQRSSPNMGFFGLLSAEVQGCSLLAFNVQDFNCKLSSLRT